MSSLSIAADAMAQALGAGRPHVSFKAGRCDYDASSGLVTADQRKGVLQVVTAEDSLTHLQWRTRPNGEVDPEHDLIVFPGETEMTAVRSSNGRVYVLKWTEAATRMFFWMQDGDASADAGKIERLNAVLQNGPQHQTPPVPPSGVRVDEPNASPSAPSSFARLATSASAASPTPMVTNDDPKPDQPATTANATANATGTATTNAGASGQAKPGLTMEALSRMLDAMPSTQRTIVSVGELLRHADVADACGGATEAELAEVYESLPEGERTAEGVRGLLRCEAVQAQALSLTRALYEADAREVLPSLGLAAPTAAGESGLKALIEAVKKAAAAKRA